MKYLKITLHDKDFYNELEQLGEYLLNRITNNENFDIENVNVDALKNLITEFIAIINVFNGNTWFKNSGYWYNNTEYPHQFTLDIKIYCDRHLSVNVVDQSEVQADNGEDLYVPICNAENFYDMSYFII